MKVLSLFDGISCGMVALQRAGIQVDRYVAYEIEQAAIEISRKNYPQIEQRGDVTTADFTEFEGFDLLIGGSPCQDLSNYKYDRGEVKGLEGEKSGLFYHYVRALKEAKPKYYLLENVASMEERWKNVISQELGVEPIMINSSLLCAAERKRLYWTNIPGIQQPEDRNVVLNDIVLRPEEVDAKYWYGDRYPVTYNGADKKVEATIHLNGHRQAKEVYNLNGKCNTILCDGGGGNLQKKVWQNGQVRKLTPLEYERLQTLPDNYTDNVCDSKRYSAIGNGWTVDVIAHIFSYIPGSEGPEQREEPKGDRKSRAHFTPEKGKIYQNEGGGTFECIGEPDQDGTVLMRNTASGWTFNAHGVGIYENGTIDWNYSTEGRFDTETTPIVDEGKVTFHSDIAKAAVQTWGKAAQVDMAIEEMSELTKALLKERRAGYKDPDPDRDAKLEQDIAEEMANVSIMLLQLEIIFQNRDQCRAIVKKKMSRLQERIRESEGSSRPIFQTHIQERRIKQYVTINRRSF